MRRCGILFFCSFLLYDLSNKYRLLLYLNLYKIRAEIIKAIGKIFPIFRKAGDSMAKRFTVSVLLLCSVIALSCISGCGSSSKSTSPASGYDSFRTSGAMDADAADDTAADETASGETAPDSSASENPSGAAVSESGSVSADKLIYSADMSLQTLEYDVTLKKIHQGAASLGGFIESESESDYDYSWYQEDASSDSSTRSAYLSLRIPSAEFQGFLDSLCDYGKVMNKSLSTENISKKYSDTQKRKEALQIEADRLTEMMEKAETIEDMISVESRLTEVETQLNQINTDISDMDTDIAYSTVNVSIEEVKKYSTSVKEQKYIERISEAFQNSWKGFANFFKNLLIVLIYLIPVLVTAAAAAIVVLVIRKKKKRKKEGPKTGQPEDRKDS